MADERDPAPPPEYRVYRSRRRLFGRDDDGGIGLDPRPAGRDDGREPSSAPGEAPRRRRRRPTARRVLKIVLVAVAGWLALSLVLFLVSAQIQRQGVSDAAGQELGGAGYTLTSPNTILVL